MAFDEKLGDRIRKVLGRRAGVSEKQMFGGLAFLLDGKMFIGIAGDDLMVRVGPEGHDAALKRPHARPMDFTGRPMRGYVFVAPKGTGTTAAVKKWVEQAMAFVVTLEPGPAKRAGRTRNQARRA